MSLSGQEIVLDASRPPNMYFQKRKTSGDWQIAEGLASASRPGAYL
jgi:hypothetical protein